MNMELQILTIPRPMESRLQTAPTLYLTEVDLEADPPDPVEKNDVTVLFAFEANVTDFSLANVILTAEDDTGTDISEEVSFVSALTGKGCAYAATLRFPGSGGAGQVTLTVPENTVAEGNPETVVTVRYSDDFPKSDWGLLFSTDTDPDTPNNQPYDQIVSIDSEHIYLRDSRNIHVYDWTGNQDTDATYTLTEDEIALRLDVETYLVRRDEELITEQDHVKQWESAEDTLQTITASQQAWTLTEDGRLLITKTEDERGIQVIPIEDIHAGILKDDDLSGKSYDAVSLSDGDYDALPENVAWYLASGQNNIYIEPRSTGDHYIYVYNDAYELVPSRRIPMPRQFITYATLSLFYFQGFLFRYDARGQLHFLDVSVWTLPQPIGAIYPQAVVPGERLDLFKFMHNATDVVFDVGFEMPDWLSIEGNRYLVISEDAAVESSAYIQLRGINTIGGTALNACGFYVSVTGVEVPVWKEISTMTLGLVQEVNLLEYVEGADFVEWVYGSTVPEGLEIRNSRLKTSPTDESGLETLPTETPPTTHQVALRAGTRQGFFADTAFGVTVLSEPELVSITDVQGYEVFIEGIDVTAHLDGENLPEISNNLDWVRLNQFTRGRCVVTLRSDSENGGYFNETNPDSFWKTHSLNESGYLNEVQVFVNLRLPDESAQSKEIFKGVIFEVDDRLGVGRVGLQCIDSSYVLKNLQVSETVAGVPKLLELPAADEEVQEVPVAEGRYTVEGTFGEMIPKGSAVDVHTRTLTLKAIQNAPEGVTEDDTAFMTEAEVRTQGGYLSVSEDRTPIPVLVKTQTPHRYLSPQAAVEKLVKQEPVLLTVDARIEERDSGLQTPPTVGNPSHFLAAHIRSNGNLAFPVERGRLLRYPVDWIVDDENGVIYYLLSNPVNYISDALVCYDVKNETHQVLYEFDPALTVLSLASWDFDTFGVIVTDATDFDRSVNPVPKVPQSVALGYDASVSENTQIVFYQQSVHHYKPLIEKETAFRPQMGLHYWVGVSGLDYIWRGITRGVRDGFRFTSNEGSFVYRYAKGTKFGVACRESDGSVSALFTRNKDAYQNHLNFAFDMMESEDVFFASVEGTDTTSTLRIEKRLPILPPTRIGELEVWHVTGADRSGVRTYAQLETIAAASPQDTISVISSNLSGVLPENDYYWCRYHVRLRATVDLTSIQYKLFGAFDDGGKWAVVKPDSDGNFPASPTRYAEYAITSYNSNGDTSTVLSLASADIDAGDDFFIEVWHYEHLWGQAQYLEVKFNGSGDFEYITLTETFDGNAAFQPEPPPAAPTLIFERTQDLYHLREFDDAEEGAWLGVHEVLVDGDNIYLIVPVSRNGRDISTDAGVILYRYNQVTEEFRALAKYDFVQYGPCMLTKHDGEVYFVESPAVSYLFEARNRDIVFDASEAKGFLKRIHATGEIETLGNVYFDNDRAYGGQLPMRGLSFDNDLHFVMGYGDPASIGQPESDASRPENWQWFSFGRKYRYKVPVLPTEGSISEVLTSLATTVGATVSIDKNILSLQNRRARGAFVAAETVGVADTEIAYAFANHAFPATGYLLIGSELVRYRGRTATHFTGISRGELATSIEEHPKDALITFVHRPIEARNTMRSSEPYLEVTVSLDSDHLYNSIEEGSPVRSRVLDAASQSQFGSNPLQLALSTTEHELPWVEFISKQYLERFKDLAYLINVRVRAFYAVNLGEIVCFKYLADAPEVEGYLIAMQVMSVRTGSEFTTIRGRQVTPVVTPEVVLMADPNREYLITDGGDQVFLVDAGGNTTLWFGDALYYDVAPTFEVSTLPKLTLVQYVEMTPVVLPAGVSPIGNAFTYTFSASLGDQGLKFDPRTRTLSGTPIAVMAETDYTYTATDADGQVITLTQAIEVLPAIQAPVYVTDGAGGVLGVGGRSGVVRWQGY